MDQVAELLIAIGHVAGLIAEAIAGKNDLALLVDAISELVEEARLDVVGQAG